MSFRHYYEAVLEKAGMRLDRDAVRYFYDQGTARMDIVVRLVNR